MTRQQAFGMEPCGVLFTTDGVTQWMFSGPLPPRLPGEGCGCERYRNRVGEGWGITACPSHGVHAFGPARVWTRGPRRLYVGDVAS